jgi:hypothetical protein
MVEVEAKRAIRTAQDFDHMLQISLVGIFEMGAAQHGDNRPLERTPDVRQRVQQPGVTTTANDDQSFLRLHH